MVGLQTMPTNLKIDIELKDQGFHFKQRTKMYIGLCHHGSKGKCLIKHVLVDYCGRFFSESMEMIDCFPIRMQTMPFKGIRKLRTFFKKQIHKSGRSVGHT
jgi:hypothetical protein